MKTKLIAAHASAAKAYLELKPPDPSFWTEYQLLWQQSKEAAFQAPSFLRYLSQWWPENTATYRYYHGRTLLGAVYFLHRERELTFLSNEKSDYNCFVLHQTCDAKTMTLFFKNLIRECALARCRLRLHCFPKGNQHLYLRKALQAQKQLHWVDAQFSACPLILADSAEQLFQKITISKSLRRDVRRLKRKENVSFEFLQDDSDLEQWTKDFCHLHIKRWKNTDTPSRYTDPAEQQFLQGCLRSWIDDGILMRSAIIIDGQRVSLNFGLLEPTVFIGRGQAYDTEDYGFNSLGRTLIMLIGEWLQQKGYHRLNMGLGTDRYKQVLSNHQMKVHCVSIASRKEVGFLAKAYVYKWVWERGAIRLFYRHKIKPLWYRIRQFRIKLLTLFGSFCEMASAC